MSAKYSCIVADPPWSFGDKLGKRGAEANYTAMTVDELRSMARGQFRSPKAGEGKLLVQDVTALALCGKKFRIADDAILFLWRVNSMPQEALDVVRYWGFEVKSELTWIKAASEHDAKIIGGSKDGDRVKTHTLHFGMGRYVRMSDEKCFIAGRGKAASLIKSHSERSVFFAPVPRDKKGKIIHSAKPPEFYEIVERLVGPKAKKLELFARQTRPGWTSVGHGVGGVVKTPREALEDDGESIASREYDMAFHAGG